MGRELLGATKVHQTNKYKPGWEIGTGLINRVHTDVVQADVILTIRAHQADFGA